MAKKLAMVFGIVFVLVGLLGFGGNSIVGSHGIFVANGAHNVVHLLIGVVLLIAASMGEAAATTMTVVGVVYLLVAVLGFFMKSPLLGLVAVNTADNWLHVVLGVALVWAGQAGKKSGSSMPV